jgi:hypothetical protein
MSSEKQKTQESSQVSQSGNAGQANNPERRAYHPPVLRTYGDVRGLTLGGSPGTGDSGGYGVEKVPQY